MYRLISIVLSVVVVVLSFFWHWTSWIVLSLTLAYILVLSGAMKMQRYRRFAELSEEANELLEKYGHIYRWGLTAQDMSAACGVLAVGTLLVGVVNCVRGFYWGIPFALTFILSLGLLGRFWNPIRFLDPRRQADLIYLRAHEELAEFITRSMDDARKNQDGSIS